MTLDKFGRHIELHKTRKYIDSKVLALTIEELNQNVKRDIDKVKIELLPEINRNLQNLRSIVILQLKLNLEGDIYKIVNSNNSESYQLPCTGRVLECRIKHDDTSLNYRINESKRVSTINNKNVMRNDKLSIYPYPVGLRPQNLYLEIILETAVYHVKN